MAETITLDVRPLPPFERYAKIFELWENLGVGETLEIINDHDPRPLHYQFMHEREGEFTWHSQERRPQEWVAHITRIAPPLDFPSTVLRVNARGAPEPVEGPPASAPPAPGTRPEKEQRDD